MCVVVFFFNDTATTEIYTLSLHDALPICERRVVVVEEVALGDRGLVGARRSELRRLGDGVAVDRRGDRAAHVPVAERLLRSEEHTSELQSRQYLVCRLLLEKNKIARAQQP